MQLPFHICLIGNNKTARATRPALVICSSARKNKSYHPVTLKSSYISFKSLCASHYIVLNPYATSYVPAQVSVAPPCDTVFSMGNKIVKYSLNPKAVPFFPEIRKKNENYLIAPESFILPSVAIYNYHSENVLVASEPFIHPKDPMNIYHFPER